MASLTQQSSKLQGFKMVALISIYPCNTNVSNDAFQNILYFFDVISETENKDCNLHTKKTYYLTFFIHKTSHIRVKYVCMR